jgi:uncharacterized protein (TIGR03437 family)
MKFGKTSRRRIAVVAALVSCSAVYGDILVVPNAQATAPGNAPFRVGTGGVHIQEVVGSGQFAGPITIKSLRVRAFPGGGPVNLGSGGLKVTLSTTQAYPNTGNNHTLISPTFANNVGPDATVVFNGTGAGVSPGCAPPGPCPFDMIIPLTVPFNYDSGNGRLLIDFVSTDSLTPASGQLDGVSFPDSLSSTVALVVGDPGAPTGTLALFGIVFGIETASLTGPVPTLAAVRNAFSLTTDLSPGALVNIYGSNFGSTSSAVSVTVAGKSAYIVFVSPIQVTVQIPFDASPGNTTLTVSVSGANSAPFNVSLAAYAPAFSTVSGTGTGLATVLTTKGVQFTSAAPASPGDVAVVILTGLGQTNPTAVTGITPASPTRSTSSLPIVKIGGVSATVLFSGLIGGSTGTYQINFTIPPGLQGSQPIVVTIGGVSTKQAATVPIFGITSIVNNASQASAGTAVAGSFVTLKVNGVGSTDQLTGFPATKFQGVQVTFNAIPAPLFHLIANPAAGSTKAQQMLFEQQIDLLIPNELPTSGNVNVQLTTSAAFYPNYSLKMAAAVPGLYRIADPQVTTRFNVIAQFNNTVWLALPASTTTALQLPGNCSSSNINPLSLCGQPATIGDYLVLYVTGLGVTTPNGDPNGKPLATGVAPPADGSVLYKTPTTPSVTIGGVPVNLLYSGLPPGFAGLYQLVFQIPSGVVSGDDVPVTITMFGNSDTATISIQPRQ